MIYILTNAIQVKIDIYQNIITNDEKKQNSDSFNYTSTFKISTQCIFLIDIYKI